MARSRITLYTQDLITDSGSVLWSFVKGEQLEFPIVLDFILDANAGYTYEAVVLESQNVVDQEEPPLTVEPAGAETTLTYRLPDLIGTWSAPTAYNAEEVVLHEDVYYKLLSGAGYISSTPPGEDSNWEVTTLNRIYIQFASTLASDWTLSPQVNRPVYGYFELRVTEPNTSIYQRTWKPVRGLVEILFSPTDLVL